MEEGKCRNHKDEESAVAQVDYNSTAMLMTVTLSVVVFSRTLDKGYLGFNLVFADNCQ